MIAGLLGGALHALAQAPELGDVPAPPAPPAPLPNPVPLPPTPTAPPPPAPLPAGDASSGGAVFSDGDGFSSVSTSAGTTSSFSRNVDFDEGDVFAYLALAGGVRRDRSYSILDSDDPCLTELEERAERVYSYGYRDGFRVGRADASVDRPLSDEIPGNRSRVSALGYADGYVAGYEGLRYGRLWDPPRSGDDDGARGWCRAALLDRGSFGWSPWSHPIFA